MILDIVTVSSVIYVCINT